MEETVDILACGAHPDDIEIGMGGTVATYIQKGYNVAFLTLTLAELSSNGDIASRQQEAKAAAQQLGVSTRYQLEFPDRGLTYIGEEKLEEVVDIIRLTKPTLVFMPAADRHPDHGQCGALIKEAIFNAGIRRYGKGEPHKVKAAYSYFINGFAKPDFVVDVTDSHSAKVAALQAYKSQFVAQGGVQTPLTDGYIEAVIARDRLFGKEVGVALAEGFIAEKPLVMANLLEGCGR
ncbi:MAG: bacillithiol biosynthesis deacetylase BshB1 [Shouchella clausii]|jgi:N-acetylglucosamine malate deacetylase 1